MKSKNKILCKVCPNWEIKIPARCSNTLGDGGQKIYFCTRHCKERYLKAPEKFA